MQEPSLFDSGAPSGDAGHQAADAASAAGARAKLEQFPETNDAIARLPEALRDAATAVAARVLDDESARLAAKHAARPGDARDAHVAQGMSAHTAKLLARSAVGYFANSPWHVADAATLRRVAAALDGSRSFQAAQAILDNVHAVSLFVAAVEDDDRSSYLKSVKAILKRHKVHSIVLDGELIEWRPESDFRSACEDIGLRPMHVGIADRESAARHGMLTVEARACGRAALFIDSRGRALQVSDDGAVLLHPETTTAAPPPQAAPQSQAPALAPTPPEVSGPSTAIKDRIANLRSDQRRRAASRP